jgi:hypothetical protein
MKVKTTQKNNIRITLTQAEASFLSNILMNGLTWNSSGKTGDFAESLHNELDNQNVVEGGDPVVNDE